MFVELRFPSEELPLIILPTGGYNCVLASVASGRVFVNSLNLIRMDIKEQHIVDTIVAIRRVSTRPDAESIFKSISRNNASNFAMSDIEDALYELKHKGKIESSKQKKVWTHFFL